MTAERKSASGLESEFLSELLKIGLTHDVAKAAASCVMHCLQRDYGGERVYVPVVPIPKPYEMLPEMVRAGFSEERIRVRLGVCTRTINRWRELGLLNHAAGAGNE